MIRRDRLVKVLDFGLAKLMPSAAFAPPEVRRNAGEHRTRMRRGHDRLHVA